MEDKKKSFMQRLSDKYIEYIYDIIYEYIESDRKDPASYQERLFDLISGCYYDIVLIDETASVFESIKDEEGNKIFNVYISY